MGRFPEGTLRLVSHRVAEIVGGLDRLTHYELLEVDPAAERPEIAKNYNLMVQAYREIMSYPECSDALYEDLVLLCQRLSEAAWVLSDPDRRQAYDGRAAQRRERRGRREESLHPITRRGTSGELELEEGFELDEEPTVTEFTPLLHDIRPPTPEPEPALGSAGQAERGTQFDAQFTAETVGFGSHRDTVVTQDDEPEDEPALEEPTAIDKNPFGEDETVPMQVPPAVVVGDEEDR